MVCSGGIPPVIDGARSVGLIEFRSLSSPGHFAAGILLPQWVKGTSADCDFGFAQRRDGHHHLGPSFVLAAVKILSSPVRLLAVAAIVGAIVTLPLLAATAPTAKTTRPPGQEFGYALAKLTGIAISPLLGASAVGAWEWSQADTPEEKAALPWFANPGFWLVGLLVVGGVAAKDVFGAAVPAGFKKPLDALEVVEDKASALVAAGVILPSFGIILKEQLFASGPALEATLATAGLPVAAGLGEILLTIMTLPFTAAAYAVVWLVSHAITVLILLSPFPALDAVLKAVRISVLGSLAGLAQIAPQTAGLLSLVIVIVCALLAGWSFRLTVFGSVFAWDFFTLKRKRFTPTPENLPVFSASQLRGVPKRSFGRLVRAEDGELRFSWRPWLILAPKFVSIDGAEMFVGKGLFYSVVRRRLAEDQRETVFLLSPRYRGHEEAFAVAAGLVGVEDAGLRKGLKAAFQWLRELLSGTPEAAPTAASA